MDCIAYFLKTLNIYFLWTLPSYDARLVINFYDPFSAVPGGRMAELIGGKRVNILVKSFELIN